MISASLPRLFTKYWSPNLHVHCPHNQRCCSELAPWKIAISTTYYMIMYCLRIRFISLHLTIDNQLPFSVWFGWKGWQFSRKYFMSYVTKILHSCTTVLSYQRMFIIRKVLFDKNFILLCHYHPLLSNKWNFIE